MDRLDKYLTQTSSLNRDQAKKAIKNRQVKVNQNIITQSNYLVDPLNDQVFFNDQLLNYQVDYYLVLNKPSGYVTSTDDPLNPTVMSLIDHHQAKRMFPVGRLDKDTTGLLLITTDGQLAHQLLSPKKHVVKGYLVDFDGDINSYHYQEAIDLFAKGVTIKDNQKEYLCLPAQLTFINDHQAIVYLVEGKYHQVKKMFAQINLVVTQLQRFSFGSLQLDSSLPIGKYRMLNSDQIDLIKNLTS